MGYEQDWACGFPGTRVMIRVRVMVRVMVLPRTNHSLQSCPGFGLISSSNGCRVRVRVRVMGYLMMSLTLTLTLKNVLTLTLTLTLPFHLSTIVLK